MKNFACLAFAILLIGLSGCDSGSSVTRATGIAYEVIVVMDKAAWDGLAGIVIKEELTSPVPYLPQAESSMRYTYVRPDLFDGLLKHVRNILIINIDANAYTKATLLKESNKWAKGQAVLYLNAPDAESIEFFLNKNRRVIVEYFNKEEMKRSQAFLRQTYSPVVMDSVQEKFDIRLYAPSDIKSAKAGEDFLWFSNDAAVGRMDLIVYTFPFVDDSTFTLNYLVAKRDSFLKENIPGVFPGSYMSTEKRVVDYSATTMNGKYCGILRGLWRMEGGDMMGGPFVSYARVDAPNKRVIVTEGFVFEPSKEKRNYIRRLEAALQTTLFPDEQNVTPVGDETEGASDKDAKEKEKK